MEGYQPWIFDYPSTFHIPPYTKSHLTSSISRYFRSSQNIHMAKQLKPIEGHIAQINAPRFAEDRNMWVMMLKKMESGYP